MSEYERAGIKCQRLLDQWGSVPKGIPLFAYVRELGMERGEFFHTYYAYHPHAPQIVLDGDEMALPPLTMALTYSLKKLRGELGVPERTTERGASETSGCNEPPDSSPEPPAS